MQQGRQGDFGSSTSKAGKPCMASVLRVSKVEALRYLRL